MVGIDYYLDLLDGIDMKEMTRWEALERCIERTAPFMEYFACIITAIIYGERKMTVEFWGKGLINMLNDVLFIKLKKPGSFPFSSSMIGCSTARPSQS